MLALLLVEVNRRRVFRSNALAPFIERVTLDIPHVDGSLDS
jgi:hypothetical protein